MLRVLIADDEPLVRISLREIIQWEDYGCEIAAEAANGKEALKAVRNGQVDLVIVDIQMPVLDGISFLEQLRDLETGRKPAAVVLSAYSNYEYVRKAFLLGAVDYIVKEDLEETYVGTVIGKTVAKMKASLDAHEQKERESRRRSERLKEQELISILRGKTDSLHPENTNDQRTRAWLSKSRNSRQVLVSLLIDRNLHSKEEAIHPDERESRYLLHTARQILAHVQREFYFLALGESEYVLLLIFSGSDSDQAIRRTLTDIVGRLSSHFKQYMNLSASMGAAEPCQGFTSWEDRYKSAQWLANLRFFMGPGRCFFPEDGLKFNNTGAESSLPHWDTAELLHRLEMGHVGWEEEFNRAMKALKVGGRSNVEEMMHLYRSFLWELGALIHAKGYHWHAILEEEESPFAQLEQLEQMSQIHSWLHRLTTRVFHFLDPRRLSAENVPGLVERTRRLIERHYHEPLSLTMLSEWVGVSESHLSKQFVKQTGENFMQYLTRIRVEKAMGLMGSGMKIYEIGEKVGYPNQGHFSRIFKKVTGKSPVEFRDS